MKKLALLLVAAFAVVNPLNLVAQSIKLHVYDWKPTTIPIHNILVHWDGPCGVYTIKTNGNLATSNWGVYDTVEKHDFLNTHLMTVYTIGEEQMFFKAEFTPDADQSGCLPTQLLIITHPTNQVVYTNFTTTFVSYTIGPDDRTHQWFKNGAPIGGATNMTYSFDGTLKKDEAVYHVEVSSSTHTLASTPAALVVVEDEYEWPTTNPVNPPSP